MKPKYLDKNPCYNCSTGYAECAGYMVHMLKCCKDCKHPKPLVWTNEDREEMRVINEQRNHNG